MQNLNSYDVIINTIPNEVFKMDDLKNIKQGALVIETASKPCLHYEENMQFVYLQAPKLPQIYSLQSASNLVISKIEEVLDD